MQIAGRQTFVNGVGLPYDAEVEYLQSDGTQVVDTGLIADRYSVWVIDCAFTSTSAAKRFMGQTSSSANVRFAFGRNANGTWYAGLGNLNSSGTGSGNTSRHSFMLDAPNKRLMIDEMVSYQIKWTGWGVQNEPKSSLLIFGRSYLDDGHIEPYTAAKVWYSRHYSNGVLVRDFQPVRVGTKGYLYDRISKTLFGNGDLAAGPDK